jgi:hypothetical protein
MTKEGNSTVSMRVQARQVSQDANALQLRDRRLNASGNFP